MRAKCPSRTMAPLCSGGVNGRVHRTASSAAPPFSRPRAARTPLWQRPAVRRRARRAVDRHGAPSQVTHCVFRAASYTANSLARRAPTRAGAPRFDGVTVARSSAFRSPHQTISAPRASSVPSSPRRRARRGPSWPPGASSSRASRASEPHHPRRAPLGPEHRLKEHRAGASRERSRANSKRPTPTGRSALERRRPRAARRTIRSASPAPRGPSPPARRNATRAGATDLPATAVDLDQAHEPRGARPSTPPPADRRPPARPGGRRRADAHPMHDHLVDEAPAVQVDATSA